MCDGYLIIGDVDATERERIRLLLGTQTDAIVFATSRIMSTGVNIKNLHNIVTTSSNQSQIQTLQTIGRLMRLHQSKETAVIYDLVDKLDYNNKPNYTLKHVESRLAYYQREGHPVKFISILLNESLPDSIIVK
jgi:superfamily II DNA or RNA helicase